MIINMGLVKVQRYPYSFWSNLKRIKTKKELADFIGRNPEIENLLKKRVSPGSLKMINGGKIKDNCELDFICETIKSAVLRAGGTETMSWGIWKTGNFSKGMRQTALGNGRKTRVRIGNNEVLLPVSHIIEIGKEDFRSISKTTERVSRHIQEEKILTRVDFVYENGLWIMVDAGESNTTLATADSLFSLAGLSPDFLGIYLRAVFKKYNETAGGIPGKIAVIPEDKNMVKNLPFEFEAMEAKIAGITNAEITRINRDEFFDAAEKMEMDMGIRCFRHSPENMPKIGFPIIDPVEDTKRMKKSEFYQDIPAPAPGTEIPKFKIMGIGGGEWDMMEIRDYIVKNNIGDFVLKPAEKPKNHPVTAYFYNLENEAHIRQLRRSLRKLISAGVKKILVEEMRGSEAVEGKKLELRAWNIRI